MNEAQFCALLDNALKISEGSSPEGQRTVIRTRNTSVNRVNDSRIVTVTLPNGIEHEFIVFVIQTY